MTSQFKRGLYRFEVVTENKYNPDERDECVVYQTMTSKKQADTFAEALSIGLVYNNGNLRIKKRSWEIMPDTWENL